MFDSEGRRCARDGGRCVDGRVNEGKRNEGDGKVIAMEDGVRKECMMVRVKMLEENGVVQGKGY